MRHHSAPFVLRRSARRRGSALIVALIFSLVIAISLGSFVNLSTSATRLSYRTFYQGVAMNIAESGLEQALWEINKSSGTWTGWTPVSGGAYRKSFPLDSVAGGASTVVKVYAKPGSGAYVIARAIVTPPQGSPIEKWIKVTLSKKSRFSVGGLGRKGIVANGNQVEMASWNSDPDNNPATAFIPFSEGVKRDKVPLATLELDASLNSGQADVNGTAAVGGDSLDAIKVGTQGYIGPFGTAKGVKNPDSVSTNFSTDLEVQTVPNKTYTSLGAVGASVTLPRPGDSPNADGIYYYYSPQISLTNATLAITEGKNVVINTGSLSVGGGSGSIAVGGTLTTNTSTGVATYTPSSLKIYTDGNVDIGGQGAGNQVTTQTYTPGTSTPVTTTVTTTISNVTNVYGKGQYKNTVIGWSYKKTIKTVTTPQGGTTTTTTVGPASYTDLIANGYTTAPAAGDTVVGPIASTSSTPSSTTVTGTIAGQPNNFWLIGTRTDAEVAVKGPQSFKISGNGNLSAVVDAPNASISAKGGGNSGFMYGSLIGYDLTFTGNDGFYYDESLANLDNNSKLGINDWDELVSGSDRSGKISNASTSTYADLMNF